MTTSLLHVHENVVRVLGPSRWILRMSIILRLDVSLLTSLKGSAISQSCFWRVVIPDVSWTRTKSGVSLIFKRFLNFHWLTELFYSKVWVLEVLHEIHATFFSGNISLGFGNVLISLDVSSFDNLDLKAWVHCIVSVEVSWLRKRT